jgi:hypothetical protein
MLNGQGIPFVNGVKHLRYENYMEAPLKPRPSKRSLEYIPYSKVRD